MKTIFTCGLTFCLYLCFLSVAVNAQTWQWTHPEPNGNPDFSDAAHDIETDAFGNVYVLGDFDDSLFLNNNFITENQGSYLAKYDSTGKLLWYKLIEPTYSGWNYAGGLTIRATDLTVTSNGVFITGKYASTGSWGTVTSYGCDGSGTGTILSYRIGNYNFNSGFYNEAGFFVTKFNSNGGVAWNRIVTGQVCFENNYNASLGFVNYNPLITSDKNNNIICEFVYQHFEAKRTSLTIGAGTILLPPPGTNQDILIVFKMNNAGTLLWSNYAFNNNQSITSTNCNSLITDNSGNAFLYGIASDGCQFGSNIFHTAEYLKNGTTTWSTFIAKISSAGTWRFTKDFFNSGQNWLSGGVSGIVGNPDYMTVDAQNNLYALVNFRGYSYGTNGILLGDSIDASSAASLTNTYLVKLNNVGDLIWHTGFGSNDTYANSIHFTNNSFYIAGGIRNLVAYGDKKWYFSNLTVLPTSPDYGGSVEYFISKANTNGDFQWATSFSGLYNFMQGFAIKSFNDNVYTSGIYKGNITTLGNLNGTYNDPIGAIENLFLGKLKDQYIKVGVVTPTSLIPGCTITIPFTSTGLAFSATNKFTAELSNANGDFATPISIGNTTSTGTGSITATIPASLTYGSGFRVRIRSSDTLKTGFNYYAYADTAYVLSLVCPAPSAGFAATNITGAGATLNWTAVGCASGYKVQYRVKGTTGWTTLNITTNTATLNIAGLSTNTIYQWKVATKCRNNGTSSFSAFSSNKQFTTATAFVSSATVDGLLQQTTGFRVYPNPASSTLNISAQTKLTGNTMIRITDMAGKTVYQQTIQGGGKSFSHNINISKLSPGAYIVALVTGNQVQQGTFIKE